MKFVLNTYKIEWSELLQEVHEILLEKDIKTNAGFTLEEAMKHNRHAKCMFVDKSGENGEHALRATNKYDAGEMINKGYHFINSATDLINLFEYDDNKKVTSSTKEEAFAFCQDLYEQRKDLDNRIIAAESILKELL